LVTNLIFNTEDREQNLQDAFNALSKNFNFNHEIQLLWRSGIYNNLNKLIDNENSELYLWNNKVEKIQGGFNTCYIINNLFVIKFMNYNMICHKMFEKVNIYEDEYLLPTYVAKINKEIYPDFDEEKSIPYDCIGLQPYVSRLS